MVGWNNIDFSEMLRAHDDFLYLYQLYLKLSRQHHLAVSGSTAEKARTPNEGAIVDEIKRVDTMAVSLLSKYSQEVLRVSMDDFASIQEAV